jgi:hypothetical protein
MLRMALGPSSQKSVTKDLMHRCAVLAREFPGVRLHTHLAENPVGAGGGMGVRTEPGVRQRGGVCGMRRGWRDDVMREGGGGVRGAWRQAVIIEEVGTCTASAPVCQPPFNFPTASTAQEDVSFIQQSYGKGYRFKARAAGGRGLAGCQPPSLVVWHLSTSLPGTSCGSSPLPNSSQTH